MNDYDLWSSLRKSHAEEMSQPWQPTKVSSYQKILICPSCQQLKAKLSGAFDSLDLEFSAALSVNTQLVQCHKDEGTTGSRRTIAFPSKQGQRGHPSACDTICN